MSKSEILSWRLSPDLKVALERRARMEGRSVSGLLDRVVQDWLRNGRSDADDEAEQARLHREVAKYIGTISGGNPRRAETARETIRERLRKAHERRRPR
jgi:hypothetical protein